MLELQEVVEGPAVHATTHRSLVKQYIYLVGTADLNCFVAGLS